MNNTGWLIYIISFLIGIFSYICCVLFKKKGPISINDYLFDGNSKYTSPISIMGAFFSIAFLYSTLPTIYLIYGKSILFVAIISSLIGFYILKRKILRKNYIQGNQNHSFLYGTPNNNLMFFLINFIYLFFVLLAEVAAFSYGIKSLNLGDVWSPITVYMVCGLILTYVYISGFRGVLMTDIIQIVILFISLFVFVSLAYDQNTNYLFLPPAQISNNMDIFLGWTAAFITGVTWIGAAPELWIRLTTLKQIKHVKSSIHLSMIGVPFLFIIPLIWLNMAEINNSQLDISSTYAIWNAIILESPNKAISLCFILVIITAFFTTVDTFVVTISQFLEILKNRYVIVNDLIINKLRKYSITICSFSILLGCYFPVNLNFVLGILAYNLSIPIFIIIYVIPHFSIKYKIPRIPNHIFIFPLTLSFLYTIFIVYPMIDAGLFVYHNITIFTLIIHIVTLFLYIVWHLLRGKNG